MSILNICPKCGGVGCSSCEGYGATPYDESEDEE